MTFIVHPKNKKEEKVLEAILQGLSIGYYTEDMEDAALIKAMEKGKKTKHLTSTEKSTFVKRLKSAK